MKKVTVTTASTDVSLVCEESYDPSSISASFRMAASIRKEYNSLPDAASEELLTHMCEKFGCDKENVEMCIEILSWGGKLEYESEVTKFLRQMN